MKWRQACRDGGAENRAEAAFWGSSGAQAAADSIGRNQKGDPEPDSVKDVPALKLIIVSGPEKAT